MIDTRFSEPGSAATPWSQTRGVLEAAELFWTTTVRADGRPHVSPLVAVWLDDALHFSTGAEEQKAELEGSVRLLRAVGAPPHRDTLCYPYGDYDGRTLEVAAACGFKAGFTTKVALAQVDAAHRWVLPRLDTNDLPKSRDATNDDWARRV